jgi:hypothetical protein
MSKSAKKTPTKRMAPGVLPSPKWMKEHGYGYIVRAMQKHPEAFAHIKQQGK